MKLATTKRNEIARTRADLSRRTRTDGRTRHRTRRFQYTEAVRQMADPAPAYWLIDMIALFLSTEY
jgi:hypothetical protein